jgi:hypothetical protein
MAATKLKKVIRVADLTATDLQSVLTEATDAMPAGAVAALGMRLIQGGLTVGKLRTMLVQEVSQHAIQKGLTKGGKR